MADPKVPKSAKGIVQQLLDGYGLGSIINWAWNTYIGAGGGQTGMDAMMAELPNTSAFKARFPAYQQLAKAGRAMSVQQMVDYEHTARQIFQASGLPPGFYDHPDDFAKLMLHDVSATELQNRVQLAQQATLTAPPEVRGQLQQMYDIKPGDLTAYYLDPAKALPIIQQQYTAATIGAAAVRTQYGQLSRTDAEGLAQLGVTDTAAAEGFGKLGAEKGLFEQQSAGEDTIGKDVQLGAQFGNDAAAQLRIAKRQQARTADFSGSSGTQVGQKGVSGLGVSDQSRT